MQRRTGFYLDAGSLERSVAGNYCLIGKVHLTGKLEQTPFLVVAKART